MSEERGDCYEAAANALLMPDYAGGLGLPEDTMLVHGRPTLARPPFEEYGHAWLELGDVVFDLTNGRLVTGRRERYYEEGNIDSECCLKYTRQEARRRVLDYMHYGPWEGPEACPPRRET